MAVLKSICTFVEHVKIYVYFECRYLERKNKMIAVIKVDPILLELFSRTVPELENIYSNMTFKFSPLSV